MNRVVNFDFPTDNPENAKHFFSEIFGWKFTEWLNEEYWLIETGDKHKQGINGSMIRRRHEQQMSSIMVQVENIDLVLSRIQAEGGEVVFPKKVVPKVGYIAYFKDPENNVICIMEFDVSAK
ncbi:MAG: VOC family protein [Chitinophagales bacterium]|nr:VOC family protein [Chitinophagales bacterium]